MSRVHNAMRGLEYKSSPEKEKEKETGAALSNLVGALLAELADEVPDDPKLEAVRADLLAASRSYESCKKKDLALRFYLATRSLLREHELLEERLRKAEKKNQSLEAGNFETLPDAQDRPESKPPMLPIEPGALGLGAGKD